MADKRYKGKEEDPQKKDGFIKKTLKTGAVVGGAAAVYKHRKGIANVSRAVTGEIAEHTSRAMQKNTLGHHYYQQFRDNMHGLKTALGDDPSLLRVLRGSVDQNIQARFKYDFERGKRNRIEARVNQKTRLGGNTAKHAEEAYLQVAKRDQGLTRHQYAATQSFRGNKVLERLSNRSAVTKHDADFVAQALADYNLHVNRIFDKPDDHIDDFVKRLQDGKTYNKSVKFENKDQQKEFREAILETLRPYSDVKQVYKDNQEALSVIAKNMETGDALGLIEKMAKSKSYVIDSMKKYNGVRDLTLRDTKNMSEEQKRQLGLIVQVPHTDGSQTNVDLTKGMQEFLDKHKDNKDLLALMNQKGIAFNFEDLKLDDHLLINHATGEIFDNRHIVDGFKGGLDFYQENFRIPFLNINGLELTPWSTFRSGERLESLQVLRTGQVQGFIKDMKAGENIRDAQFKGSVQSQQTHAIRGGMKNSDYFYSHGNLFKTESDGKIRLVDENLYMVSSQHGAMARMHQNMTGYTKNEMPDQRGKIAKIADLGYQEGESIPQTISKSIKKLSDPLYGPNAMRSLLRDVHTVKKQDERIYEAYDKLIRGIEGNAQTLSSRAAEVLSPKVNKLFSNIEVNGKAFDFSRLDDDDYLLDASLAFYKEFKDSGSSIYKTQNRYVYTQNADGSMGKRKIESHKDPAAELLEQMAGEYITKQERFIHGRRVRPNTKMPSVFDSITSNVEVDDQLISNVELLRRSFHQYAMRALDDDAMDFALDNLKSGRRVRSSLDELMKARNLNILDDSDIKIAKDLEVLSDLMGYDDMSKAGRKAQEARTFFEDILNKPDGVVHYTDTAVSYLDGPVSFTGLGAQIQESIERAQPKLGRAPEPKAPPTNGADFFLMRKSNIGQSFKQNIADINLNIMGKGPVDDGWDFLINTSEVAKDMVQGGYKFGKDVGRELFAGRHRRGDNLEDVTTATALTYGLAERLSNSLSNWGLGNSIENLGSFQSIIGNQYLRRIVLPYAVYQQAMYFDGLTGDAISDTAADAYVTGHETLNQLKEVTGINRAMRPWAEVFKRAGGADQIGEWVGVKQLDFLTMGLFSDFRSGEEVREFYESGDVAIRKNRYWGIGSPSAWAGGGIDRYEANWYRKLKSDYKFTETMYGSEKEYWANHWMPTLTNPLAPIRHFITDPYHWEDKHEVDRPYAITGGFSEFENLPIVGGLVNSTVGRILKPTREHKGLEKAHEEYLSSINQYIQEQYSPAHDGSYVTVSPTGEVESYNVQANPGTGEMFGGTAAVYGADAGWVNYGNGFVPRYNQPAPSGGYGGGFGYTGGGYGGGYTGYGWSGSGMSAQEARSFLAEQNYTLAQQGSGEAAASTRNLHKLHNKAIIQDLDDMEQINTLRGGAMDGFYSTSELFGIYGFLTKTGISYDESWRGTTLAPSTLMTSYSRSFWDQNLGGLGGSLSEIGRRYIPRDMNKDYYSPIRNTMPDWLPGIEGSVDFLHGDPYSKIEKGEMRLPGAAYESLHKLHPDGTGTGEWANYGVFDRFRILADVAPDSDQYAVAKHQVSLLRQAGGMTEEMEKTYNTVLEQVESKKDSIRFYDRQFSNANIKTETVTITKVLDGNTFMVREHDSPIKLAGIDLQEGKNDDAIQWLSQFLQTGAKIKIGIAEEAAARHNNDSMNSISAVVYANKNEQGRMWFESMKGQSLNEVLANRNWANEIKINDDGSPTATRALYSNDMVTVGKVLEWATHDFFPKLPFVGILADKFLQVRSPIESYKHDQVYNSDWKPWQHPIDSFVKPAMNTIATQNPLIAGAEMAAIGHMFGKKKGISGHLRIGGFFLGAGISTLRVGAEAAESVIPSADGVWIPKERRTEREINEYFDRLKYIKYKALYEKTADLARQKEGVDVEAFFDEVNEKSRRNKGLKRYLENSKKTLSQSKKIGYGDPEAVEQQIEDLSGGLEEIEQDKQTFAAGKYTSLAIRYRKEYEETLYGMHESGNYDRSALMKALTPKEREYVPRFQETTSSKERNEILKYVTKDIRRVLQSSWGMEVDKTESIESYFRDHYLPDAGWEGWSAAVNLDDVKIKVMQKKGINPTNSGYWEKDQARADQQGAKAIPISSLSSRISVDRLRQVLNGAGLSDVDVQLTTSYGEGVGGINTTFNLMKDIKDEFLGALNEGVHTLFQ